MLHQLFPTNAFTFNMIGDDPYYQMSEQRFDKLVRECYTMRKKDPVGRARSNDKSGWKSNDGVEDNPVFQPMINRMNRFFEKEVFPFYGATNHELSLQHGNYWVNINGLGGHNHPHTHPGCWYSGVIYMQIPKGMDRGGIQLIDQSVKHYSQFPMLSSRTDMWWRVQPEKGLLILFPSGTYHFVEPNDTDGDRISIAFNNSFVDRRLRRDGIHYDELPYGMVNTHDPQHERTDFEDAWIVNPDGTLEKPK